MSQHYSNPARASDPHALPDIEVFELTALEFASTHEDTIAEWSRKPEYRLANINAQVCNRMFDAMIEELGITGGWFYWYCQPGCMPDSEPIGPYASHDEALAAARAESGDEDDVAVRNTDPTREELIEFLAIGPYTDETTEFDREEAIYWFAANYHSGQWSNLYSVLSTSEFHPGGLSRGPDSDIACELYNQLVQQFGQR